MVSDSNAPAVRPDGGDQRASGPWVPRGAYFPTVCYLLSCPTRQPISAPGASDPTCQPISAPGASYNYKYRSRLLVISWNAEGVRGKASELGRWLSENKVDVAAIQEAQLAGDTLSVPGYQTAAVSRRARGSCLAQGTRQEGRGTDPRRGRRHPRPE